MFYSKPFNKTLNPASNFHALQVCEKNLRMFFPMKYFYFLTALCTVPTLAMDVVYKVDEKKGLKIVTAGGVSAGLDASLWLIGDVAGRESLERAAEAVQHAFRDGVVI